MSYHFFLLFDISRLDKLTKFWKLLRCHTDSFMRILYISLVSSVGTISCVVKMIVELESALEKQQEAEKTDMAIGVVEVGALAAGPEKLEIAGDKKASLMDRLKSKLNIVSSQPKVEKALENKVKTPGLSR